MMTTDIRKPGEEESTFSRLARRRREREAEENGWATATRRVLLYLKALGVHPRDSLILAQEALDRAEGKPGSPPVQAAMAALKALLRSPLASANGFSPGRPFPGALDVAYAMAVPPAHPGQMPPAMLDRRPWVTFLSRCARRCLPVSRRPRAGRGAGRPSDPQRGFVGRRVKEEGRHAR